MDRMTHNAAEALATALERLGVRHAFGVSGGAISTFWAALAAAGLDVTHFRHESGAAFAACEASIAAGAPVVVFVTTGPGLTNVLTGVYAARHESAKVILVSAHTDEAMCGRHPIQETGPRTFPQDGIFTRGPWFDYAAVVTAGTQLPGVLANLSAVATKPTGFVAHLSLSLSAQRQSAPDVDNAPELATIGTELMYSDDGGTASRADAAKMYDILRDSSWLVWAGGGARAGSDSVRRLARIAGVATMATPRGKGVIAETDRSYLGVTGFAGHPTVLAFLEHSRPDYILVLGTGMGDFASGYSAAYTPKVGFIHVDLDGDVPGRAYPSVPTTPVLADVGVFCEELADLFESEDSQQQFTGEEVSPFAGEPTVAGGMLVDPRHVMDAVQAVIVDRGIPVMAETGNGLAWAINRLRIGDPTGWRAPSGLVGAMGHFSAGVVGAALATSTKVAALVGDGSMLMNNEISTAVHRSAPAIWIVLNDGRYNMCEQGAAVLGLKGVDCSIPDTDFAALARALGARGLTVGRREDLVLALESAVAVAGPVVVDVRINPQLPAPTAGRNAGLLRAAASLGRDDA